MPSNKRHSQSKVSTTGSSAHPTKKRRVSLSSITDADIAWAKQGPSKPKKTDVKEIIKSMLAESGRRIRIGPSALKILERMALDTMDEVIRKVDAIIACTDESEVTDEDVIFCTDQLLKMNIAD